MLFGQNEVVKAAATNPKVRFNRFNKMTLGSKISFIVILLLVVAAVFAPVITPYSPMAITESYQTPTGAHLFGTDNLGRDVLTRVIFGARYSLVIGLSSIAFALVLGSIIGAIAAVSRAWVSEIIMRLIDIVMSIPGIALAAVFVAVLGQSMIGIIISIGVLYVPQIARIVRANIISEYGKDYVRAVIVSGARAPWILIKHVMRNIAAPVMVFTTLSVADAIVFEASLSFINAGIPEPTPTWGNILSSAKEGVIFGYWWQALYPGLAIMITVLCLNILSEGITDAMVAAPTAPVEKTVADVAADRKEDRLLTDPVAAYAEQHDALVDSLTKLRNAELKRTDRLEPWSTEPPCSRSRICASSSRATATSTSSTTSTSPYARGRRWVSSASPAAASRSPRSPSWACSTRRRESAARSCSTAGTSWDATSANTIRSAAMRSR